MQFLLDKYALTQLSKCNNSISRHGSFIVHIYFCVAYFHGLFFITGLFWLIFSSMFGLFVLKMWQHWQSRQSTEVIFMRDWLWWVCGIFEVFAYLYFSKFMFCTAIKKFYVWHISFLKVGIIYFGER